MTLQSDYKYKAYVHQVLDGDTFDAFVLLADYGFNRYEVAIERFRLLGINTWEIRGNNKDKGLLAKTRTEHFLLHRWITLESHKTEKYGRWLASVNVVSDTGTTILLSDLLIIEGHGIKMV